MACPEGIPCSTSSSFARTRSACARTWTPAARGGPRPPARARRAAAQPAAGARGHAPPAQRALGGDQGAQAERRGARARARLKEREPQLEARAARRREAELDRAARAVPNMATPTCRPAATRTRKPRAAPLGRAAAVRLQAARPRGARPRSTTWSTSRPAPRSPGQKFYFLKNEAVLLELALRALRARRCCASAASRLIQTPDLARAEILEGHRLQPARRRDADLLDRGHRPVPDRHRRDHPGRACTPDEILDEERAAAALLRPVALLPHRGRRGRPRARGPVPRAPVHQGRDVRAHAARGLGGDARGAARDRGGDLPGRSSFPTACSTSCTGDLGGPAYRKFDIEAWMPGRGDGGELRRDHQHLELHRLPGAPARHPLPRRRRGSRRASSTCSTARPSPRARARSRSSRSTSRPTARSASRRRSSPTRASTASAESERPQAVDPETAGRGDQQQARDDARGEGTARQLAHRPVLTELLALGSRITRGPAAARGRVVLVPWIVACGR